jgi:Ni,Fe-hydrogenase III small subunit/ferredoxin
MIRILRKALRTGRVTIKYPHKPEEPPEGFLGKPSINFPHADLEKLKLAESVCPTRAISLEADGVHTMVRLSYARCIFCGRCAEAYPEAIAMTKEFELASLFKTHLEISAKYSGDELIQVNEPSGQSNLEELGEQARGRISKIFGRSLHIREVDAGSCNGCELEIAALNNPLFDLERFGLHFVASPRHADMLLVTGPVTRNMEIALRQTYEAMPAPKLVVATGACACSGGVFGESYACKGGVDKVIPVDAYIPGCPPRPQAILHGILLAIGRIT